MSRNYLGKLSDVLRFVENRAIQSIYETSERKSSHKLRSFKLTPMNDRSLQRSMFSNSLINSAVTDRSLSEFVLFSLSSMQICYKRSFLATSALSFVWFRGLWVFLESCIVLTRSDNIVNHSASAKGLKWRSKVSKNLVEPPIVNVSRWDRIIM